MPYSRLLLVLFLSLSGSGCRMFEKLTKERTPADAASRDKAKEKDPNWLKERQNREPGDPPKDWLAGPAPAGRGNRVPPAENWADPASRGFDSRTANGRTLSGTLLDADGRVLANTYITVENADPTKAGYGAPMGVESDRDGFFEINGLSAGEHYTLSAQVKNQAGRAVVQVPNTKVKLQLKEDYVLPARTTPTAGDLPPRAEGPKIFDSTPPKRENPDWSPLPTEKTAPRGDLVAPGPQPEWRPPPASIPSAPPVPSPTVPTVPGPTSKSPNRSGNIVALGDDGRQRMLLSGRSEDLVLLDFFTSTCGPCKKAIPALTSFHNRYGKQVEIVGILCDGGSDSKRVDLARQYQDDNRLPYAVRAESGRQSLQDTFDIQSYPTLVLLDGTGRRLWKGHPKDLSEVEKIVRNR